MKKFIFLLLLAFIQRGFQNTALAQVLPDRPALVLGIVVDQMRQDHLYRYSANFGNGGFRRMLREGFSFRNCQYAYIPTYTAPGHASIFTGTTPFVHGIVGNNWLDEAGKVVYCTRDDSVKGIGEDGKAGKMSPANLKAGTVADQIRLAGNFRGKAFGISLKDRGAILPAGHSANAAFWYDFSKGNFISSTWYRGLDGKLPGWLENFNRSGPVKACLDSVWKPLLPAAAYSASTPDLSLWESPLIAGRGPVFPYSVKEAGGAGKIPATPFGNQVLARLATELIAREGLGSDSITDFLSVSFSSTDIIGHAYGPNSMETEDCYLRLDRDLASLFRFLDEQVGKGKWLCFLSSDHGVMEVPAYLNSVQIPARLFSQAGILEKLREFSQKSTGKDWFSGLDNLQVYWKKEYFDLPQAEQHRLQMLFCGWLENQEGISRAFPLAGSRPWPEPPHLDKVAAGYYRGRSGHIQLLTDPFYMNHSDPKGTTHGSPHAYDSQIPCLWLGWKVAAGEDIRPVAVEDIAPGLSVLLKIAPPNAATGKALPVPIR